MTVTTITSFDDEPIDGFEDEDVNISLTGTEATLETLTLTIPSHWNTWTCYATGTVQATTEANDEEVTAEARIQIDGTNGSVTTASAGGTGTTAPAAANCTASQRRTGITSTGSVNILLRGRMLTADNATADRVHLYAIARRTG